MSVLLVDVYEPLEIVEGLKQSVEAIRFPLNSKGLLDFWWKANDHSITVERKEICDFIGSLNDGSLVDRLRMAISNKSADEIALLIEGIYSPHGTGTRIWRKSKNEKFYFAYRTFPHISYNRIQSTLYALDKAGCTIYHSNDIPGTIITLSALHNGSHKADIRLLDKYHKAKPIIQTRNPYVEQLMSVHGVGEVLAKELIMVYGTPYAVYSLDILELSHVAGVGSKMAKQILGAVGRL